MLVITAIAVVRMHSLFAIAMLSGVFSLLSALLFVTLDAVDVAFTEARLEREFRLCLCWARWL